MCAVLKVRSDEEPFESIDYLPKGCQGCRCNTNTPCRPTSEAIYCTDEWKYTNKPWRSRVKAEACAGPSSLKIVVEEDEEALSSP